VQPTYSAGLDCENQDHTASQYNPLGAAVATTGLDGLIDYNLIMGLTNITFNRAFQGISYESTTTYQEGYPDNPAVQPTGYCLR
jgi:hypothetical protein